VFTHCVRAEHRAPSVAAAYLITRGIDAETAIGRAGDALGGGPTRFLRDALVEIESVGEAEQ
jgi:hypothetical protein